MEGKCGAYRKFEKEKEVQCDLCQFWYHMKCAEVSQILLDFLQSEDGQKGDVHWYCKVCEQGSRKLFEQMVVVDKRLSSVEQQLEEIKVKIDQLSKTQCTETPPAIIQSSVSHIAREMEERGLRKCNIVIHGLKDGDEHLVNELIRQIDDSIETAEKPIRLGAVTNKSRPLLVKLKTEREKWKIIGKSLRVMKENNKYKGVYVNPDLTKSERDEQYSLRQKLRERRDSGEDVIIKRGLIVPRAKN